MTMKEPTMILRMSEVGQCIKAQVAKALDYEPISDTPRGLRIMREASRHEEWVVEDLQDNGCLIERAGICSLCSLENTWDMGDRVRKGIHAELVIKTPDGDCRIIGHLDGKVWLLTEDAERTLEIKALGRFTFGPFLKNGIGRSPEYAYQVSCGMLATGLKGMLAVKNRDDGEIAEFLYDAPPVSLVEITEHVSQILHWIRQGKLPEVEARESCRYCPYRHICSGVSNKAWDARSVSARAANTSPVGTQMANTLPVSVDVEDAALLWLEGNMLRAEGEEKLAQAKGTFLSVARQNDWKEFQVLGLRVRYYGERSIKRLDEKKVKEAVSPEVLAELYSDGKPYPDIRITQLGDTAAKE